MKNKLWLIAVVTAILFYFITCEEDSGGDGGGGSKPDYTGTDIADFETWLETKPANTAATAYSVKLNVDNLGGDYYTAGSVGNALYTTTRPNTSHLTFQEAPLPALGKRLFCIATTLPA